jgi:ABC-type bacteriocin/lantibiotic exporter with double-glycine peptidase domain
MKVFKIIVRGHGPFPIDLLRRELCWPRATWDSLAIIESLQNFNTVAKQLATYTITLTGLKMPVIMLWRECGYCVVKVEGTTLKRAEHKLGV